MLKKISFLVLFFWTSIAKASNPCVAEVCIGDGLKKLSNINWIEGAGVWKNINLEIQHSQEYELRALEQKFQGNVIPAAEYIKFKSFNKLALPKLEKITASCEYTPLLGRFISNSGNMTDVEIALLPVVGEPSSQQWKVLRITRHLNTIVTQEQGTDAVKILSERYREYFYSTTRNVKEGDSEISISQNYSNEPSSIIFTLSYVFFTDVNDKLKKNNFCGGARKANVD